jgi:hypothetical protein
VVPFVVQRKATAGAPLPAVAVCRV